MNEELNVIIYQKRCHYLLKEMNKEKRPTILFNTSLPKTQLFDRLLVKTVVCLVSTPPFFQPNRS